MEMDESQLVAWETREDIALAVKAAGLSLPSEHQLENWRYEGLLPRVKQVPNPYHGSATQFPSGTAKQTVKIIQLLAVKKKLDFVGWELWWAGFPVDEKYWKPHIEKAVNIFSQQLNSVKKATG